MPVTFSQLLISLLKVFRKLNKKGKLKLLKLFCKVRLTREQKRSCVELFKTLDADHNGCLDEEEMFEAMKAQGFTQYQLSDARTLVKQYDTDGIASVLIIYNRSVLLSQYLTIEDRIVLINWSAIISWLDYKLGKVFEPC